MSAIAEQFKSWTKTANTEAELVAKIADYTKAAEKATGKPAHHQEAALREISKLADRRGRVRDRADR